MKVNNLKRPWMHKHRQGARHNPDPFYQSPLWKATRTAFMDTEQEVKRKDGSKRIMSNRLCIECFKDGRVKELHTVDHIVRIKAGGSRTDLTNLQGLCQHHHAVKSAKEAQGK